MTDFMIRFLICNIFVSGIIGLLLVARRVFKNSLSSRMQYNLWFLLIGLLAVPFIPLHPISFPQIITWIGRFGSDPSSDTEAALDGVLGGLAVETGNWMNDFTLSVNSRTPSLVGSLLFGIWVIGILAMTVLVIKSWRRLRILKKSALPLQNQEVRSLYRDCLKEAGIHRYIPIYSTAFLKSPITVGVLKPCIYLPIHLISDYNNSDLRYMLLHELMHYKHFDAIAGYLMNLAGVVYWFNPLVWYTLKEMRTDREVACDISVLELLEEDAYKDYGNTLINFAEKLSLMPFPFAAGLAGNMKQIQRRIVAIASYKKPTFSKRLKSITAFLLTAVLLFIFIPFVSTYAADETHYQWKPTSEKISTPDLSSYFGKFEGSFVLYDWRNDAWSIYNRDLATLRVSPDSTYKIYVALFGLEEGVITPENTFLPWDGVNYPFAPWNADQTLQTAMSHSVNWYFQALNEQLGSYAVQKYIQQISYGNRNIDGDLSSYWMESSLKISPIEQAELLVKLNNNSFHFDPENINAVKNSIRLSSSYAGTLYGKTGTGRINGQDVNGWFIGYVETSDNTYYFAINIGADSNAAGSSALDIALAILYDMSIWTP